ncbi:MFS family permease [Paenibacillus phyllosphaerae]|uniref:MFS family permease n=1 Tax=Paenibacillus phyllosphaerae TaxID=274593 RepID=A0A7W5B1I3_9BACL|nr:MFS family permease [Paenibacillus phyllosphaerae]
MNRITRRWFGPEIVYFSVILFVVEFVRGAALVSFLPVFGQKTLGLNFDVIGIAITAHYLTDTALKMGIGYLLDRFSVRFVVHTGLLASLAGIALLQFAYSPWLFIAAAALYGVGISPIWIVCLTKVTEGQRATQMGYLYTIWLAGLGIGPIICNVIVDHNIEACYYLLLGLSLLCWLMSLFISNKRNSSVAAIPLRQQFAILGERLRHMKLLLPGMILQTAGAGMLVPILPSFAENHLGMSGAQYSLLLLAGGVCTGAALMPFGKLSDKLGGKKWFLVIGFIFIGLSLYMIAMEPPLVLSMLLAGLLGLSYSALLPAWNALLANYVPPQQAGLGWGIFSTVEGIGGMIGPVIGGVMAASFGEPSVVLYSAILYGLIGFFYIWFPFRDFQSS